MEKFKYKFALHYYVLIIAGILLALACLILNLIRYIGIFIKNGANANNVITLSVLIIVTIAALVIFTATLIDSSYVLDKRGLTIKFGVIKTLIDYNNIKQIVLFKTNNKLTVFLKDETFNNIVISDTEYPAFVSALLEKNSKIVYYEDFKEEK